MTRKGLVWVGLAVVGVVAVAMGGLLALMFDSPATSPPPNVTVSNTVPPSTTDLGPLVSRLASIEQQFNLQGRLSTAESRVATLERELGGANAQLALYKEQQCFVVGIGGYLPGYEDMGIQWVGETEVCGFGLKFNEKMWGPSIAAYVLSLEEQIERLNAAQKTK